MHSMHNLLANKSLSYLQMVFVGRNYLMEQILAFYTIATVGKFKEMLSNYIFGLLFGLGLVIAGMCRISKI